MIELDYPELGSGISGISIELELTPQDEAIGLGLDTRTHQSEFVLKSPIESPGAFSIKNIGGDACFQISSNKRKRPYGKHVLMLQDERGETILEAHKKRLKLNKCFTICSKNGTCRCYVRKSSREKLYRVYLVRDNEHKNPFRKKYPDLTIRGSFDDLEYVVFKGNHKCGDAGVLVAQISRYLYLQRKDLPVDYKSYGISVAAGVDIPLLLFICLIVDISENSNWHNITTGRSVTRKVSLPTPRFKRPKMKTLPNDYFSSSTSSLSCANPCFQSVNSSYGSSVNYSYTSANLSYKSATNLSYKSATNRSYTSMKSPTASIASIPPMPSIPSNRSPDLDSSLKSHSTTPNLLTVPGSPNEDKQNR